VRNGVLFTRRGFFPDLSNNDYLSFILTGTGGTVQIAHGPPSNSVQERPRSSADSTKTPGIPDSVGDQPDIGGLGRLSRCASTRSAQAS